MIFSSALLLVPLTCSVKLGSDVLGAERMCAKGNVITYKTTGFSGTFGRTKTAEVTGGVVGDDCVVSGTKRIALVRITSASSVCDRLTRDGDEVTCILDPGTTQSHDVSPTCKCVGKHKSVTVTPLFSPDETLNVDRSRAVALLSVKCKVVNANEFTFEYGKLQIVASDDAFVTISLKNTPGFQPEPIHSVAYSDFSISPSSLYSHVCKDLQVRSEGHGMLNKIAAFQAEQTGCMFTADCE